MTVRKSKFLFPNFRVAKVEQCNKMGIVILDSPVSYSTMLQELRSNLNFIGLKGNEFSLHSVRVGALSEIANSNEVDKSVLQRHGRWKTIPRALEGTILVFLFQLLCSLLLFTFRQRLPCNTNVEQCHRDGNQ